jgi:hypothetical protein
MRAALAARIRAHLAGLLDEAEESLHSLRAEAERWRAARTRAQQTAAVETQLAIMASQSAKTAVVVAARQRAEAARDEARRAEAEEGRVRGLIDALLAVAGSLRAMIARLGAEAAPKAPPPPGSEHMARARELVAEIDALNERAFQRVREMRARAAGLRHDEEAR